MRPVLFVIGMAVLGLLIWQLNDYFPGRLNDDFSISHIIYLLCVLALLGPGIALSFRNRLGHAALYAAIWVSLLAATVVLYSFRDVFAPLAARVHAELLPSSARVNAKGEVIIQRSEDGHFYVDAFVNEQRVYFMVDTGASRVALSYEDAVRAGIDPDSLDFTMPVNTANGMTMNAYATLNTVAIPPLIVEGVRASVAKKGQLDTSLLGMSFLDELGGYRVEGDTLVLWR